MKIQVFNSEKMDEFRIKWKQLIANKKRRQILFLLRNMGVATQSQIQEEFRKRNMMVSWPSIHKHLAHLIESKMVKKTEFEPMEKGDKNKEGKYKIMELTAEARLWLNNLESKGKDLYGDTDA